MTKPGKPSVYLETSVVSYLTARPSRDVILAGQQMATRLWWEERRQHFDVFISRLVWEESSVGDLEAVKRRLKILQPIRWLQIDGDAGRLAGYLIKEKIIPQNAMDDALHIAIAAVHETHFLITWNFAHINNAAIETRLRLACEKHGFHCPVICNPEELMEI